MTMNIRLTTRLTQLSFWIAASLALCAFGYAQQVTAPGSAPLSAPGSAATDTTSSDADANSSTGSQINQRSSFTAAQIISILQQRPELVVELKSLVADQLTQ